MFVRSTKLDVLISALFVVTTSACSGLTGCGACSASAPLPGGSLPSNQTIEGGAQIRVTPAGFTKLTSILPGVINNALGAGFCIPHGSVGTPTGGFLATGAEWCAKNDGACTPGCDAQVSLNNVNGLVLSVTNQQTLNVQLSTSLNATIHLDGQIVGIGASCDMTATSNDLGGNFDIAFNINATTGELGISLADFNNFKLDVNFGNCGLVSDIANVATDIINGLLNSFVGQLLTPVLNSFIQGLLPNPLGIEGMLDVGSLLSGISPGTTAEMEARIVPGGYVDLVGNGMSLGVITGLNSDADPTTRTGTRPDGVQYASEPALCVPPLPIPLFGGAPYNLPLSSRSTFSMLPADEFNGSPDPAADLAMGISQTTLDLAGHHAVTSGALCLGVGTSAIPQLNVGVIGLLVPSLSELDDSGTAPLLLVTRPQRALTFTIGDNQGTDPALTIGFSHLEVDFYAFLFERYVRAFTLDLTLNAGIHLDFEQQPGMPAVIKPTLLGIDAADVTISVLNSEFVKETPADLEAVLPSVFSLVTPLLGNLPDITVPSFAGFSLNNLSIQKVTTSQDSFLALYATLGASAPFRALAEQEPLAQDALDKLDADIAAPQPPSTGTSHLLNVSTPAPEVVRGALAGKPDMKLPTVTFAADLYDSAGRELEWNWNFNGGLFHQWQPGGELAISDPAFAWQGKYTIGLKSRVKGDYHTVSAVTTTPVIIDSVGPHVYVEKATWVGDTLTIPVEDIVSLDAVQVAFGRPGEIVPETKWESTATIDRADAQLLAVNGEIAVFAKDEAGNQTTTFIAPFHGQAGTTGCVCGVGGRTPTTGGLVMVGFVVLLVRRRRRGWLRQAAARVIRSRQAKIVVTVAMWLGVSAAFSMQQGCSCNKSNGSCEMVSDCSDCPAGQLPFCIDNMCVCSADIPPGRIGEYSHIAAAPDGSGWVSAYASSHGDLVVTQVTAPGRIDDTAWEWVDGVPDGPVLVPGSMIRGGVAADGPDVGMYTSIAVAADGTPMVTYFDRGTMAAPAANLKFAAKVNGTWITEIVDMGTGSISNNSGSLVGMYTSLTLRADDGRPGVAYLAHVGDAMGGHAEVRYAQANVALPMGPSDWTTYVVDTAPLPVVDPNNPDVYPLPAGLGLFITSARDPSTQAPVVAYYDRAAGELKLNKLDPATMQFGTPVVLDGGSGVDDGWNPSLQVDLTGVAHVAYIDATSDALKYVTEGSPVEIVDDGYRIVGQTVDGLPKPTFDILADASLVLPTSVGAVVGYQDGTTQELLLAQRADNGMWTHVSLAGATNPWPGAYGFFASVAIASSNLLISNWVIDQPTDDNWMEVFANATVIQ